MKNKKFIQSIYVSFDGGNKQYVCVRRKSRRMKFEKKTMYQVSKSSVALFYLQQLANHKKVDIYMDLRVYPTINFLRKFSPIQGVE